MRVAFHPKLPSAFTVPTFLAFVNLKLKPMVVQFVVVAASLPRHMAASRLHRDKFRRLYVKLHHYPEAGRR
jgi:hypothetical protein